MAGNQPLKGRSTGKGTKYAYLLEDQDVRRWYQNVCRGSRITGDVYLRRIGNFRNETDLSPKDLIELSDKQLSDRLFDYVSEKEDTNSPTYLAGTIRAVKSWLNFMGKPLRRQIKVHMAGSARPTVENEKIPTQEELKKIVLSASVRDRMCVILMAHSGVRPQVMGSYMGDNGLRLRDLPELKIEGTNVEFEKIPAMIRVPASLSKAGFQYLTFLSAEGCAYLKEYLETRIRQKETLAPDSPVITAKLPKKPFITSINVSDAVRSPIRAAGFHWRPYVLRGYFDTQLLLAESRGMVAHDYRVFWMGHSGSMEARYTTNKNRLPSDMIEDMREAYRKCEKFLGTRLIATEESNSRAFMRGQLLQLVGYRQEELDKIDLDSLTDDEFQKMLRARIPSVMPGNGHRQKVVSADEINQFIEQGYEFQAALPNGSVVMKIPY